MIGVIFFSKTNPSSTNNHTTVTEFILLYSDVLCEHELKLLIFNCMCFRIVLLPHCVSECLNVKKQKYNIVYKNTTHKLQLQGK